MRTGKFEESDGRRTYYVEPDGNKNPMIRFRRYSGGGEKQLRPEHDRRERAMMFAGNRPYRIRLMALADGAVRYLRDGELILNASIRFRLKPAGLIFGRCTVICRFAIFRSFGRQLKI